MRRLLLTILIVLILPAGARAAEFITPLYDGKTLSGNIEAIEWRFHSSQPSDSLLGGVAYELSSEHILRRCLVTGAAGIKQPANGTYTIRIFDDYNSRLLEEEGISGPALKELCGSGPPAGLSEARDTVTVTGAGIPIPENKPTPVEDPLPPWAAESLARESREMAAQAEATRRAKEAAEQAEREAKEAPLKLAVARAERETAEAEAAEAKHKATMCVVPSLRDDSLSTATRALARAHCRLGKVTAARSAHRALVVTWQSNKGGKKLPAGAKVALKLAPKRS